MIAIAYTRALYISGGAGLLMVFHCACLEGILGKGVTFRIESAQPWKVALEDEVYEGKKTASYAEAKTN